MEGLFTLESADGKTRLSFRMEYELPYSIVGKIIDRLKVGKVMAGHVDEGLRNLQQRFEAGSP